MAASITPELKSDNVQIKLRFIRLIFHANAVDVMLKPTQLLLKSPCYFALFKALLLGLSPELEDYFEATLRLGRDEAVC